MIKLTMIALLLGISQHAFGQTFLIEGQITRGSLRSGAVMVDGVIDIRGVVDETYPIDYSATLVVSAAASSWGFDFEYDSAASGAEGITRYINSMPRTTGTNLNLVAVDETSVAIEFDDQSSAIWESFDFELDLETGLGSWGWSQACPVCSLSSPLPGAYATVTSAQVVPEPNAIVLLLVASGVTVSSRRKRPVVA